MITDLQVELGSRGDLESFIELLEDAATRLWNRGIHQWAPGSMRAAQRTLVRAALSEAVKRSVEAMRPPNYEYQSDFARKYFAEGRAEGEAKGQAEGEAKGRAALLLAGLDELDRWGELVLTARSIEDVLR